MNPQTLLTVFAAQKSPSFSHAMADAAQWALHGGPPSRPPPQIGDFAPPAEYTRPPTLAWGTPAFPTDEYGVCHWEVGPPAQDARHGDYLHLAKVYFRRPRVQWHRDAGSGATWIGLLPETFLLLQGRDAGRTLFAPHGTHITLATWERLPDADVLRKIVTKIETQLQSIDRKWAFGIPTWCRLPQAPHLRPAAGSPDTVDVDPDGEVSKVLQHIRRELGLPSSRFQYHIRFGLRASDVETNPTAWRHPIDLNAMD